MKSPLKIALVGVGKIARDQHIPVIRKSSDFQLACLISGQARPEFEVPVYQTLEGVLEAHADIDVVVVCTPPAVRTELARTAFAAGCSVVLEKPPAADVATAAGIARMARQSGQIAFASWHSRFAPMVAQANDWTARRRILRGRIVWHEDVRKWHPGQTWLWEAGGFGVFDPGINALSILSLLLPGDYIIERAFYQVPENARTPIAVDMTLRIGLAVIDVSLDFRGEGDETWTLDLEDENGQTLTLSQGGGALSLDGGPAIQGENGEYEALYGHFAGLLSRGEMDFDLTPLRIIEKANGLAVRQAVDPVFN